MIHRLRRRHRRIWVALAVLLPLLYVVALAARRPARMLESLPEPLRAASARPAGPDAGSSDSGEGRTDAVLLEGERSPQVTPVAEEPAP